MDYDSFESHRLVALAPSTGAFKILNMPPVDHGGVDLYNAYFNYDNN